MSAVFFNPRNNSQIITVGQKDGIFIWEFNGDIENDFNQTHLSGMDMPAKEPEANGYEYHMSKLEKIRTTNKAKKHFRNQMSEDSFIIPEFRDFEQSAHEKPAPYDFYETPRFVQEKRQDLKLSYNHYANCAKKFDIMPETSF